MKYLLTLLVVTTLSAQYTIKTKDTKYYVDKYKKFGQCITFKDNNKSKSLCHNYSIKETKDK